MPARKHRSFGNNLELRHLKEQLGFRTIEMAAACHCTEAAIWRFLTLRDWFPDYRLRLFKLETGLATPDFTIDLVALRRVADFVERDVDR